MFLKYSGCIPVILQAACVLATLNNPNHLLALTLRNSKFIGINEPHPAGSINAVQIGSRPICISLAAFLQLELFRA
ncbi:hypothetical protein DVQ41_05395 [Yersinia enterocolitica]|nr:hypothetical protein [Yersinia enterocolitica]QBP97824.1 hypothetical protein YEY1_02720 [Yersinia enterocolitica subsp. palearctica]EKN4925253.1 hypothetical protein [Yersinia enterocolitica]EKN5026267.1 hypothetical protein [Yersinia enterocolitica]EKN5079517.1 hypothetical protein [Yersinia enterocolitica]